MKIAVVGCGAVGSFYGAKLARAGDEVHFLLRADYEAVRRRGVLVRSPEDDYLMIEVIAAARALGFDIPDAFADQQIERTRTMGAYRASTLIDFERGQPLELQSLFLEPLRQATRAGVAMPRLSALCAVLKELGRRARPAH